MRLNLIDSGHIKRYAANFFSKHSASHCNDAGLLSPQFILRHKCGSRTTGNNRYYYWSIKTFTKSPLLIGLVQNICHDRHTDSFMGVKLTLSAAHASLRNLELPREVGFLISFFRQKGLPELKYWSFYGVGISSLISKQSNHYGAKNPDRPSSTERTHEAPIMAPPQSMPKIVSHKTSCLDAVTVESCLIDVQSRKKAPPPGSGLTLLLRGSMGRNVLLIRSIAGTDVYGWRAGSGLFLLVSFV